MGRNLPSDDVYSVREIAAAAGMPVDDAGRRLQLARAVHFGGYFVEADAVRLVRMLAAGEPLPAEDRAAVTALEDRPRRSATGLLTSGAMHAGGVALLVIAMSWGLLTASTDPAPAPVTPARLVFFSTPGPGGGGGGGGIRNPLPPRRAERKTVVPKKDSSPVPPPPPRVEPIARPAAEPPPPIPVVQAPIAPVPADPVDVHGTVVPEPAKTTSQGSGAGGGAGTGSGNGMGAGDGAGVGDGSGGGTGGGPYRAGAGIEPPRLLREVKAEYTDAARRRGIEGQVLVEIVVRRDGTVGDVRVLRRLDDGLDRKAVEAVRQWRFEPARRHGAVVDVIVEVSLQFTLR